LVRGHAGDGGAGLLRSSAEEALVPVRVGHDDTPGVFEIRQKLSGIHGWVEGET